MNPSESPRRAALPIHGADLRGLARLGVEATVGMAHVVEAMHHTIASRAGIVGPAPAGRTSGITGGVYSAIRGTARVVGRGMDAALAAFTGPAGARPSTPEREAALAALNGVWGDHLADSANPLAITMSLRVAGQPLDLAGKPLAAQINAPNDKLVVLVHGLCMNDLRWTRDGHDHGAALARDLGVTPLYLHYNTGRHVSQNGRDFAALLGELVARWPVPVRELTIVGHSMGGLVTRSACDHAARTGQAWLRSLTNLVFLGTPHHGAPLERGGRWVDQVAGLSPYVAPLARLTKARSAGITDLRFGNLHDADWQGRDRHAQRHDDRRRTPLPEGVATYLVAATTAAQAGGLRGTMIGDGLVPVASALGQHRDPALTLEVPEAHRRVVTSCSHLGLLGNDEVYRQLKAWLGAPGGRPASRKRKSPIVNN